MKRLGIVFGILLVFLALGIGAVAIWGQSQEKMRSVKVIVNTSENSTTTNESTSTTIISDIVEVTSSVEDGVSISMDSETVIDAEE